MEKANYSNKDIKLKMEGLNLNIDKDILDDQRTLEVSTKVADKEKVSKDDKVDFENFKVLYADAIKDKCMEDYGVCDDDKLLEDTAKEMYLASKTYIPEEDKKADGELEKKTESKEIKTESKDIADCVPEKIINANSPEEALQVLDTLSNDELIDYTTWLIATFVFETDNVDAEIVEDFVAEYMTIDNMKKFAKNQIEEDMANERLSNKVKTESKLVETESKQSLYDEISRVLTDYENNEADENDLYRTLVKIQNRWEDTITTCESKKKIENRILEKLEIPEKFEVSELKRIAHRVLPAKDIDEHDGDLYIRKSDKSTELLKHMLNANNGLISTFTSNLEDGDVWYDIPFANWEDDYKNKVDESVVSDYTLDQIKRVLDSEETEYGYSLKITNSGADAETKTLDLDKEDLQAIYDTLSKNKVIENKKLQEVDDENKSNKKECPKQS